MPKIEVNEELFYSLVGRNWDTRERFETALTCAKAELDAIDAESVPVNERLLKIELNDTNRPDLWGTAGCARQLRVYYGGKRNEYPFFSQKETGKYADDPLIGHRMEAAYTVKVQESVQKVRPFLAGFIVSGKAVTDTSLRDMIQTQEKLAWNFGRKRRTVSMGLYRIAIIQWPIIYKGVDPDSVSFTPLQWDIPLTLREILKQHPKGKEYGFIQEHEPIHPLLVDSKGDILSYPPIINSADLGAVQVGDTDLFIELTGTDIECVTLSASIMACDFADQGYTIEPVNVEYEYDTPHGRKVTTPFYFQEPVFCSLARVEKFLGEKLSADECIAALSKMGVKAEKATAAERGEATVRQGIYAFPPEYRNDFLHAADVVEDVMIGRGLSTFAPTRPSEFTIGRLSPITILSRKVKEILVGMGYQEMVFNYLGSKRDFVDKMLGDGAKIIKITNPMTENYEYVRDSILASLLISESMSGNAIFPHRIFETGKVAYRNPADDHGTSTRQFLGFLTADKDANFNMISAQIQTLFYYLSHEYVVEPSAAPHFIAGRAANVLFKDVKIGIFGEIHPQVLENWGITTPCVAAEIDLDTMVIS
ncbi:MAG: phenylalanine--tRNA ligase subunit beta [Treponema sp.]|jgi:phenylalanyl-tRNA synthetase beta chain|nr:phenylalanine--tRNA ligase subunit beta [Treponema sp.]